MNSQQQVVNSLAGASREHLKRRLFAFRYGAASASTSWFAPALAAAIVAVIGVWLAAVLNIWIDEAYTIHTTGRGLSYALQQATTFELQPPLYFLLIAAWRLLDESAVGFARLPSVAFAAAATAIIVIAARQVAPRVSPGAIALATALNPIMIWAAVEIRVYALVLLIAATLTLAFLRGFLAPRPVRGAQVWYALAGIAGLYTQFYIGFILLAFAITLIAVQRRVSLPFAITNAIIGLAFLPFVPTVLQEIRNANGGDVRPVSLLKALHEMLNANFVYVLPHELGWSGAVKFAGFIAAATLVATLLFLGRPKLNPRAVAVVWIGALASLIFSALFAIVGEVPDVRRHAVAIAPLSLLTAFAVVSGVQTHRRPLVIAATVTYCVFAAASLWWLYRPPISKTGDWRRVAALVASSRQETEVVIFPPNLALALGQYFPHQQRRLVPFPQPMTFTPSYLTDMKLRDEAQVARSFHQDHIGSEPFWIISDNSCDPGPQLYDFSCGYLTSYLHKYYIAKQSYFFHGAIATLYEQSR